MKGTLSRSAVVGLVATLVNLGSLGLLVDGLHVPKALANLPALALGLVVQFIGNKRWAFRDRSPEVVRQGMLFAAVEAGAFVLNAALFQVLGVVLGLPWLLARVAGSALVYFGFSYRLWARIFRTAADPAGRAIINNVDSSTTER